MDIITNFSLLRLQKWSATREILKCLAGYLNIRISKNPFAGVLIWLCSNRKREESKLFPKNCESDRGYQRVP